MFSVFSVLFLCNQVFGVLYSGPFKSDGSNLPPGAVTKNYSTSTTVTINATGAQNALNVVGTSNIASVLYVNKSTSRVGVGTSNPTVVFETVGTSNIGSLLYVNTGTGFVGVGTSSPTTILSVNGSASFGAGTSALPSIAAFGDLNTGAWFPAADTFAVSTGGSESLRVTSSGDVWLPKSEAYLYFYSNYIVGNNSRVRMRAVGAGGGSGFGGDFRLSTRTSTNTWNDDVFSINSTGKVGIGTTAPTTLLSVNGVASFGAGTALLPSIAAFGDLNTGAWFPAADTFAVSTSGGERLRVTSTGRLGLGNSLPLGRLDMGSSTDPFGANFISWSSGGTGNLVNIFPIRGAFGLAFGAGYRSSTTASDSYISSISGSVSRSLISARTGDIRLYTDFASNVAAGSPITPTERMRITSMGNVGIGTILPHASAILDVQSTTKGLRLPNMTAAQMYAIVSPAAGLMIWNTSSVNVSVYTGAAWANVKDL
jgi:hypothetical protein